MKKTFLLFIVLLFLNFFTFSKNYRDSEISIYNEVTSAFDTGFYPGAIEKANLLQKEYPDSVFVLPALVQKGESLIYLKEYDEAIQTLEDAISRMHTGSENFARCYFLLGKALYFSKDYNRAISAFHSSCVVSRTENTTEFYDSSILYAARIYFLQENFEKSIPLFEYVISNGQAYSVTNFNESLQKLVKAYNNSGVYNKSIELFNKIDEEKIDRNVYYSFCLSIAESYEALNMNIEAYNLYCKIVESGINKLAVVALKKSYILANTTQIGVNPADIFEKTSSTFSNNPNLVSEFWIRLGIDAYNQKNYESAMEYFAKAEESGIVVLYQQKIAIDTEADYSQVEEILLDSKDLILSSDYENISDSYYSLLLQLSSQQQNWTNVLSNFALLQNPDARAIYQNAKALYSQNQYSECIEFLKSKEIMQKYSVQKNPEIYELLALSMAKNGQISQALEVYNSVSEQNLLSKQSKLEYAKALFTSGKYKLAKQKADESELSEGKYVSGLCSINLKNWKNARESFIAYIKAESNKTGFNKMSLFYKGYSEYCLEEYKDAYASFVRFATEAENNKIKYIRSAYEFATKSALQNSDYKNAAIQAQNVLKNSITEEEKHSAVLFCSEIYSDNNDYSKAISFLMPYTEQKGDFAIQALFQIAKIYVKQGNITQADKTYIKIYSEYPDSPVAEEAMYRSGELFYTTGDFSSAEIKLNKYIYKYVSGKFVEAALFYCGDSCLKLGEVEKSIMMNKTLVQKYPKSIYIYGTYKNLMNAYYESENYNDALEAAKYLVKNFQSQSASDGIGKKLTELEKIVGGADPVIAELLSDYEKKGKSSTSEGRIAGTKLVQMYASNSETKVEAFILATELFNMQKDESEKFYAAQNAEVIAEYNRSNNENKKAAEMYLLAAEYYRSSSNEDTNAAAALYGAVEAFVAEGFNADAKETADLLIKLYPESKQAKNVRRIIRN